MNNYRPITDTWILARAKLKDNRKLYGAFPGGFLERARALLGVGLDDPVLHVCGGMSRFYPYKRAFGPNDKTLDLDPASEPDFLQSCVDPLPQGFKAMLADPPYSAEDAAHYAVGAVAYPSPQRVVARMVEAIEPGRRVGILHYSVPRPPPGCYFVALVSIYVGFGNKGRAFSVFEKLAEAVG